MSTTAIDIRNLSKRYRLGVISRKTLQDELTYWWHKARGRNPADHMGRLHATPHPPPSADAEQDPGVFWALRDVSFSIEPGEVVGVIGRNGAGKSTLLKILSRITEPTAGEAILDGRVGSLLEVGTGFHPDLTGRENIYMNGTILGMKKREIDARFDSIIAFADIEQFLDTPVKRYSSGMYVRLAFAVAAHLDTEILMVDEVLAVGDAAFQQKCLGKMDELAHTGRTVLFVSHNMPAVRRLCRRVVWMDHGRVVDFDDTETVLARYMDEVVSTRCEYLAGAAELAQATGPIRLRRVSVVDAKDRSTGTLTNLGEAFLEVEYELVRPTLNMRVGFRLVSNDGAVVLTSVDTDPEGQGTRREAGRYVSRCQLPLALLNAGRYHVTAIADRPMQELLFLREALISFVVHLAGGAGSAVPETRRGVVRLHCPWTVRPEAP